MSLAERLRSFHRRRIAIDVGPGDVVLDVGSGDKPHWRADVLLDGYIDDEHGGQRSGTAGVARDRPLFVADAADMPFADDAFAFVICSHVLEHVTDPAAVAVELSRVAAAGYVEVPEAASAKIMDFPTHLWWCRRDADTLVFTAKQQAAFDAEIEAFIARAGLEGPLTRLFDAHFDDCIVSMRWSGHLDTRVVGALDPAFVEATVAARAHHRSGEAMAARVLTKMFAVPERRRRRTQPVTFNSVVRAELRRPVDEQLRPGAIYRL